MRFIITALFIILGAQSFAQINLADSTVQVITYWDKNEKQVYTITNDKYKLKGTDTTSRETTSYDVEVKVLNASDKSYTIEWRYKNMVTNSDNETVKKLMNISKDMKVIFKTTETGVFVEVVNWKEIKDFIHKACATLRKDFKNVPAMNQVIKQIEETYSTKEAIESVSIKDIQQFHTFHGAQYKLGEVLEGKLKAPNIYGPEPFDTDFSVYLDEINAEDNNYILRAKQGIDKAQLTEATFNYLVDLSQKMKVKPPKREDLKDLSNETVTASRIHHTGWVIYSVQTTTVVSDNLTNIEERVIEIK